MSLEAKYVVWAGVRALLNRGWWLVTSLYLVTVAGLEPAQLVLIGAVQGIVALLFEAPAGVVADTISRKMALVLSHCLMGAAMLMTGFVTAFSLILATQMLWGIAWTFSSGSDIAWITDELRQPQRIPAVLARAARFELGGSGAGIVGIGLLAALAGLANAMIVTGVAMILLGVYVALRFPERNFTPEPGNRWLASARIFKEGIALVRSSRVILVIFVATFLVDGAAEVGRIFPQRLDEIGFPAMGEPVVWLTVLNLFSLAVGAVALRIVEPRIHNRSIASRDYALASLVGAMGLVILAVTPTIWLAYVGVVLMDGIRAPLTRTLAAVQVNQSSTDNVRATVLSFLSQAEYLGEIVCGSLLVLLASTSGTLAFVGGAVLLLLAAFVINTNRTRSQTL